MFILVNDLSDGDVIADIPPLLGALSKYSETNGAELFEKTFYLLREINLCRKINLMIYQFNNLVTIYKISSTKNLLLLYRCKFC